MLRWLVIKLYFKYRLGEQPIRKITIHSDICIRLYDAEGNEIDRLSENRDHEFSVESRWFSRAYRDLIDPGYILADRLIEWFGLKD